jgi:hypothetical protein
VHTNTNIQPRLNGFKELNHLGHLSCSLGRLSLYPAQRQKTGPSDLRNCSSLPPKDHCRPWTYVPAQGVSLYFCAISGLKEAHGRTVLISPIMPSSWQKTTLLDVGSLHLMILRTITTRTCTRPTLRISLSPHLETPCHDHSIS